MKWSKIVTFAVSFVGIHHSAKAETAPLTVCEMLNSIGDHQEVSVRGVIIGEPFHGFSLSVGTEADPCPGWPRRFFTMPSAVLLELLTHPGVRLTQEEERKNLNCLRRLSVLSGTGRLAPIKATVTGVLVRKPWLIILRRADGTYWGNGEGEDGGWPAFIIVRSIQMEDGPRPLGENRPF